MGTGEEQIKLSRYLPYAIVATLVVAVAPLWFSLWVTDGSTIPALFISFALSLVLSSMGAALWKRTSGSYDLVFDDLMLWGLLRRLRAQRQLPKSLERMKIAIADEEEDSLSAEERLRLLKRLAAALETGDPYTNGHSRRVAHHAFMTAKALKLPRKQRNKIRLAALMHDVGKLFIAKEVLNKPAKLSDQEFEVIKSHPSLGAEMIERVGDDELTEMVRHHHERMDGTGYPDRLAGKEIPIGARVISVADTFDAITSRRPYRPAQKHQLALDIIEREAGSQLDADVVAAFLSYYSGRSSLRKWLFLITGFRQTLEFSLVALQRAGLAAANAAVVGGATVAIAGTGIFHADVPKPAHHQEKKIVRSDDSRKHERRDAKTESATVATDSSEVVPSQTRRTSSKTSDSQRSLRRRSAETTAKVAESSSPGKGSESANEGSAVAAGDTGATDAPAAKAKGSAHGAEAQNTDIASVIDDSIDSSGKSVTPPGRASGAGGNPQPQDDADAAGTAADETKDKGRAP
jgi:hypothetical protein